MFGVDVMGSACRAAVASLVIVGMVTSGCTDEADEPPATTDTATADAPSATGDLSTVASIDDLAEAIIEAGFTCELEYAGLEDATGVVSLCTIGDGQATLRIWADPDDVAALVESGSATELTVYGENWTIDLRDPTVARELADALGGDTG